MAAQLGQALLTGPLLNVRYSGFARGPNASFCPETTASGIEARRGETRNATRSQSDESPARVAGDALHHFLLRAGRSNNLLGSTPITLASFSIISMLAL